MASKHVISTSTAEKRMETSERASPVAKNLRAEAMAMAEGRACLDRLRAQCLP